MWWGSTLAHRSMQIVSVKFSQVQVFFHNQLMRNQYLCDVINVMLQMQWKEPENWISL